MKQTIYQVYLGERSKLYDHCVESVAAYCRAHGIQHVVQKSPILKIKPDIFTSGRSKESWSRLGYLPIFEKENAFSYLHTNDQVAVIDADVYIRPGASNIFNQLPEDICFGGVVERDMPITEKYAQKIANYSRMQYSTIKLDWKWNSAGAEFMNMGVMVMNKSLVEWMDQTPIQFLSRPEFKPFVDGIGNWKWSTDQTLLNTWLKNDKIPTKHLDWKFNALYGAVHPSFMHQAEFVHFFLKDKLPQRGENVAQLMKDIGE